jgi:crotonobetainyl-CoA:carnitine CoA-transferase CaiB-like acyl-CoA transferase
VPTSLRSEDAAAGGDIGRYVRPFQEGEDSLIFETFNRNKRSIGLDLKAPAGRSVFEDLVRVSDVVYSNLRGDVPQSLRINYFLQGVAGWMDITGEASGPPSKSGLSLVDYSAGLVAALAVLAGVHAAVNTVPEALRNEQTTDRGMIVQTEHPHFGTVRQLRSPVRVGAAKPEYVPAPLRDEHRDQVIRDLLGYDAGRIAELTEGGAFAQPGQKTPGLLGCTICRRDQRERTGRWNVRRQTERAREPAGAGRRGA